MKDEIKAFLKLRYKYASMGACDTEARPMFEVVLKRAVLNQKIDWEKFNWNLYSSKPGHSEVITHLTTEAKRIYEKILNEATPRDCSAIREMCDLVDWDYTDPDF